MLAELILFVIAFTLIQLSSGEIISLESIISSKSVLLKQKSANKNNTKTFAAINKYIFIFIRVIFYSYSENKNSNRTTIPRKYHMINY